MARDRLVDVAQAQRAVMRRACELRLPARRLRVLLAVIEHTATWSKLGDHVGHEQLLEAAAIEDRTNLRRELKALAADGLIVYRPGSSPAGGRRTASWIALPAPPVLQDPGQDGPGSVPDADRGQSQHEPGSVGTPFRGSTRGNPTRTRSRALPRARTRDDGTASCSTCGGAGHLDDDPDLTCPSCKARPA